MHAVSEVRLDESGRTQLDIGTIFRTYGDEFRAQSQLSGQQQRVMRAIERCRTSALGSHRYACNQCDHIVVAYNSCRNRHCPKCQGVAQFRWVEARKARLLNSSYFHVVFTLPAELRGVARTNPKLVHNLLFRSAAQTLLELGSDNRRLGGLLGITAILHTWTRTMAFHPHVHCVVTAGGLGPDGCRWLPVRGQYLFPVQVMGALFRGKFLAGLKRAHKADRLKTGQDPSSFRAMLDVLYQTSWVVYAKRPFGGPAHVFRYLGQYTHRVGLANSRLRAVANNGITFSTRGDEVVTLAPLEFIRRFLMHVLPPGFVKIRHYGLMASVHVTGKLLRAQQLLGPAVVSVPAAANEDQEIDRRTLLQLLRIYGEVTCPRCRTGCLRLSPGGPDPP